MSTSAPPAQSSSQAHAPGPVPGLDHIVDPNVHGNRNYWSKYDWPEAGDEWSKPWGGSENMWYCALFPRFRSFLPTGRILEIAPGFGRVTNYLRKYCEHIDIVDLVPKCIEACRQRFAGDNHIGYHVNDGRSLAMIPDNSVDFAISWDSLVHVEHETVREYLRQIATKLKPGAIGFIHHSNFGMQFDTIAHELDKHVLGGRRPSMTAEKFRADCKAFGLRCLSQELVPWTEPGLLIDSFSLFMRPNAGEDPSRWPEPTVIERTDWGYEVASAARIGSLYRRP
ncbi:MAG TPA: class I SAM-dependent methyltransferase [Phycisphaerales bacterium]|nr:class I SAM-dependent methyltransferase [Phycisphaerales bacterium]